MTLEMDAAALGNFVSEVAKAAEIPTGNETRTATVLKIDQTGTVWVSINGGADETPVHTCLVEVAPGDIVNATISNGRLTISGNVSSPVSTGRTVEAVHETAVSAKGAASDALYAANVANEAAFNAIDSANVANAAAEIAQESAESAQVSAGNASTAATAADFKAEAARQSAMSANGAAVGALMSLSDVEKVVGSLTWIAEHGSYALTEDTVVQIGKSYYVLVGSDYIHVAEPSNEGLFSYALIEDEEIDTEKTYYTQNVETSYELTEDTAIVEGKTYYVYDSVEDEYVAVEEPDVESITTYYEQVLTITYEEVEEPDVSEIATYYERSVNYYELEIDESVHNYLASHIALTDDGLNVTADSTMYRLILGADGMKILDPEGKVVGVHGETIQLGSTDGVYFEATSTILAFRTADQEIAWFGQNNDGIWEMHISTTYAEDMVRFGNYAFIKRANGNMSLKWLGEV